MSWKSRPAALKVRLIAATALMTSPVLSLPMTTLANFLIMVLSAVRLVLLSVMRGATSVRVRYRLTRQNHLRLRAKKQIKSARPVIEFNRREAQLLPSSQGRSPRTAELEAHIDLRVQVKPLQSLDQLSDGHPLRFHFGSAVKENPRCVVPGAASPRVRLYLLRPGSKSRGSARVGRASPKSREATDPRRAFRRPGHPRQS